MDENKNTNIVSNQQSATSNQSVVAINNEDKAGDQDVKIAELKNQIALAEQGLEAAKRTLFELTGDDTSRSVNTDHPTANASDDGKIIEGIFNGENMIGPEGKTYPVPANYASKSKLVEGDRLKLTISDDGKFLFKQIAPVKRKSLVGMLKFENNAYHVFAEGHSYNILYASVTFHKGKPGDNVSVVVPESGDANWAVLESIIHDLPKKEPQVSEVANNAIPVTQPVKAMIEEVEIKAPEAKEENAPQVSPEPTKEIDQVRAKLNIDSMDINSPKKQVAPDAVDPSQIQNHKSNTQQSPVPKQESIKPISEMDI